MKPYRWVLACGAIAALLLVGACDDDNGDPDNPADPDDPGDPGDPDDPGVTQYLINTAVFDPDSTTTYVKIVNDLDAGTEVDLGSALELNSFVIVDTPRDRSGTFFVGLGSEPTLQKYSADEEGTITLVDQVSFAGLGLTSADGLINSMRFVADDKAYFVDPETLQVIIWNPMAMEIVSSFELDGLRLDDHRHVMYFTDVDGDRIVASAGYQRPDQTYAPLGRVAIIDTRDDSVVYGEQTRCGFLSWTAQSPAGDIYFVSHSGQAITHEAGVSGDPTFPPCMVRMRAGASDFDPDYYVDLTELTGRAAGALIPGADGTAYVLVKQEGTEPITVDNYQDMYRAPVWEYHSFTLGDEAGTLARVPGVAAGVPYATGFLVDTGTDAAAEMTPFVTLVAGDFSSAVLYDVSDPSAWQERISAPGFAGLALRLR